MSMCFQNSSDGQDRIATNAKPNVKVIAKNLCVLAFLALWLVPVLYYAVVNSPAPWLPEVLQRRTNVSRLFSSEVPVWAVYAVQYRTSSNGPFRFAAEEDISRMRPFGRRTRLQKIIAISSPSEREELCRWLRERLESTYKEKISDVRIIAYPNTAVPNRSVEGYIQPDPQSIDPKTFEVLSQVNFSTR